MTDLHQATVFLSTSFPSGKRSENFKPYDPSGIADAVSALARSVFDSNGRLLFAGHPTITPLILMIAREKQMRNSVDIYQSRWFEDSVPPEVDEIDKQQLGRIVWTDRKNTLKSSLKLMRSDMIQSSNKLVAAFFVGGMEGIEAEYELVQSLSPNTLCIPVTGPGGGAARLPAPDCMTPCISKLDESRAYPLFAVQVMDFIEKAGNLEV